ncbi:hypothetical protein [Allorhodopirellula heiligendammensis]|uniref:hypothetical protein n=1 Tax=Allorhodopirellula heiligendammensis TaxID=2714739 RepID=UPI0011B7506B|nr:hypothetical protein [Allorhodopirellula heiligendammensis]
MDASEHHSVTDLLSPYAQVAPFDDLKSIQTELESFARAERVKEEGLRESGVVTVDEIQDVTGSIDPSDKMLSPHALVSPDSGGPVFAS